MAKCKDLSVIPSPTNSAAIRNFIKRKYISKEWFSQEEYDKISEDIFFFTNYFLQNVPHASLKSLLGEELPPLHVEKIDNSQQKQKQKLVEEDFFANVVCYFLILLSLLKIYTK